MSARKKDKNSKIIWTSSSRMYGSGSFQNIIFLPKPQEVYCSPMSLLQPLNLLGLCSIDTQIIGLKVVYAYCCFSVIAVIMF